MTITQYKKIIRSLSREDLEAHLFELFRYSKVFKDIESTTWNEADNEKLLEEFHKKLKRVFWKNKFSLSECKGVLTDYIYRTSHKPTIALMHLAFASEAAQLSASYGDYGDAFYNTLFRAAEKYMSYASTDLQFFEAHEDEFEELIRKASQFGYGVSEDLEALLYDVREELYEVDEDAGEDDK